MIINKKGVALIWSLVLSAVLLLVSGTMVSYIVKESQFSVKITDSAKAYTYAKSGVEWANQYIKDKNNESPPQTPEITEHNIDLNNDSTAEIIVTISGCVANPITSIFEGCTTESTGISQGVTRKLEYQMIPTELNKVTPSLLGDTSLGTNTESFSLQFDLWSQDSSPQDFKIGADNSSGGYIGFRLETSGQTSMVYRENSTASEKTETIGNIALANITKPYGHRAILKYIDDTAIQVTINSYSGGTYECLYKKVVDVTGLYFGDLNSLYLSSSGTINYVSGENDYIKIGDSRIDNLYSSTAASGSAAPTTYTVTASTYTGGTATANPTNVAAGESSVLSATANSGYTFSNWSGSSCPVGGSTANPVTINNINASIICFANFTSTAPPTGTVVITNPGSGSFVVPAGVSQITVLAWGAGGSGTEWCLDSGGGGGGGAFTWRTISVSEGTSIPYYVGSTGGTRDTWFLDSSTILAKGGSPANGIFGGAGGQASLSIPATNAFSGGNGGNVPEYSYGEKGGGGGGAGYGGPGGNGSNGIAGLGGAGGALNYPGGEGSGKSPGGGGWGESYCWLSGYGAPGQIIIKY